MTKQYAVSVGGKRVATGNHWGPMLVELIGLAERNYRPVMVDRLSPGDGGVRIIKQDDRLVAEWQSPVDNKPPPEWAVGVIGAVEAQRGTT